MPETDPERASVETLENELMSADVSKRRAQIAARRILGRENVDIADEFGVTRQSTSQAWQAVQQQAKAGQRLAGLVLSPEWLHEVPTQLGESLYGQSETLAFRLFRPARRRQRGGSSDTPRAERPQQVDEQSVSGEYSLAEGEVCEGFLFSERAASHGDGLPYLVRFATADGQVDYYTLEDVHVAEFIDEWLCPGRFRCESDDGRWFLTEYFDHLLTNTEQGIYHVEADNVRVLTDERFVPPTVERGVTVSSGAMTGRYRGGFKFGYHVEPDELAEAVKMGRVSEADADDIASTHGYSSYTKWVQ